MGVEQVHAPFVRQADLCGPTNPLVGEGRKIADRRQCGDLLLSLTYPADMRVTAERATFYPSQTEISPCLSVQSGLSKARTPEGPEKSLQAASGEARQRRAAGLLA